MKQMTILLLALLALTATSCDRDEAESGAPQSAILTFEDSDYQGTGNYLGEADWSSLVADDEAADELLYGEVPYQSSSDYCWYDEGNTELYHSLPENFGMRSYAGGGIAISNHLLNTSEAVTYQNQLSIPLNGGHSGDNFAVCYIDNTVGTADEHLPTLHFKDGRARVVKSMWVTLTSYTRSVITLGGFGATPFGEGDYLKIIAIGLKADGTTSRCEFSLAEGTEYLAEWAQWDLSSLGAVIAIRFSMDEAQRTSYDGGNTYYYNTPLYFAFDDVEVTM